MEIGESYSNPSIFQSAGRRQRGGGFFGKLARMALPILKSFGARVGNEALNFASNTLSDVSEGHNVRESLKKQGLKSLSKVLEPPRKRKNLINKSRKW